MHVELASRFGKCRRLWLVTSVLDSCARPCCIQKQACASFLVRDSAASEIYARDGSSYGRPPSEANEHIGCNMREGPWVPHRAQSHEPNLDIGVAAICVLCVFCTVIVVPGSENSVISS